jgi:glycosyltransferase involved in cell wall biosynthesis
MEKVTLCITCYKNDIHFLDECLGYVKSQTVQPDEILVVANAIDDDSKLKQKAKEEGFTLFTTSEPKLPGWGRNTGLFLAKHNIVSFCDVDDVILPRKIEFIKKVFNDDMDALIHNYHYKIKGDDENFSLYTEEITEIDPASMNIRTKSMVPAHQGHMTCRKEILKTHKYREDLVRGEDGTFCQGLVKDSNTKLFFTPLKLIIYRYRD